MQPLRKQFRSYIRDPWNRIDQAMYLILLLAVILRFTLPPEHFVGARYVYAINLVMFYLRVLQLYYIHRRLGPKVVVIWRMVCIYLFHRRVVSLDGSRFISLLHYSYEF